MKIIYPNSEGGICIITPYMESGLSLEAIAQKDVPTGLPYLIVEDSEFPTNRDQRQAWEADFTSPDGIGS